MEAFTVVEFATSVASMVVTIIAASVAGYVSAAIKSAIPPATPEPRGMAPVIPGSGTNENAVHEIAGPEIPVWCTGVRVVRIVAVGANGRSGDVARSDTNANSDCDLPLRIRQGQH